MKPKITIHNSQSGKIVEREMTDLEFTEHENRQEKIQTERLAKQQEATQIKEARSAAEGKLLELGLTVEDLKALLG